MDDRDAVELVPPRQQVRWKNPGDVVGEVVMPQARQDGAAGTQRAGADLLVGVPLRNVS